MNLRRMGAVVMMACVVIGSGCAESRPLMGSGDEDGPGGGPPVGVASCDGVCVQTPPATFTGPSLFWIGPALVAQSCPPETPNLGIEAWVTDADAKTFARECRITPSDRCPEEGLTCAPMPDADFHVCIHHGTDSFCPPDYPERSILSEILDDSTVTLCCQKTPVAP
ncbi:MAG: hypothetical protein U0441_36845 [Polyangiaceae bacterium]